MIKYLYLLVLIMAGSLLCHAQTIIFVSPVGSDANSGSIKSPLKTPEAALQKVRKSTEKDWVINLRGGDYYLSTPLNFSKVEEKSLLIQAYGDEKVLLSAGRKLNLKWEKYKGNIIKAWVSGAPFEQFFVNGKLQHLARYPNYDAKSRVFHGTAEDAIAPERIAKWKNPVGGYIHALHDAEWGGFHYRITGVKNGKLETEGGWQNNRPSGMHPKHRFVENIFEELDAPGEWFYDKREQVLYFYPPKELNLTAALLQVSHLKHIAELRGTVEKPLNNITIKGIRLAHTERTFMEHYEPLLRSDWTIYRGAAVIMENTENCKVVDCELVDLGGNAVLVSGYNRSSGVEASHIHRVGASAICFVGDSSAVRSATFQYEEFISIEKMDRIAGPKNTRYPANCNATNNLIHDIGQIEKQATGVEIEMASEIYVGHNTIYRLPRAGINIGDGGWGGHIIEFNDVFETVLETGDHGAFNSWGRDRFWFPNRKKMDELAAAHPDLILLDSVKTTEIRNNRFRCDHGWDIDLDDGSSNYHIYNNVCLNGGLKFREGFYREAKNNLLINNTFHPHVWFKNSGDVFENNIVMRRYAPIGIDEWGKSVNYNLFLDEGTLKKVQADGTDKNSYYGNPMFVNASIGDYRFAENSPAFKVGFKNFPMDQFGVTSPKLKSKAEKVKIPVLLDENQERKVTELLWLGGKIRNVSGLGDRSAYGLPDEKGIVVAEVGKNSLLEKSGLSKGDVIRTANGEEVPNIVRLQAIQQAVNWTGQLGVEVMRNQKLVKLSITLK